MAFMGRGGFSSIGGYGVEPDNNIGKNGRRYYRGGLIRIYYYIPLDNTYVILQMIATFIILIISGISFLIIYKPSIVDPIENVKKIIVNTYIVMNLVLIVLIFFANYFSKDKLALIKKLLAIIFIAVVSIMVFLGIKLNLNSKYNKNTFGQIYEQQYSNQLEENKTKIDVGLTGMKIKTEKEYYVDECIKAYNVFSIRMYGAFGLNILLIMLLIYQIYNVSKIQEKRDRLSKDDAILFDEEENIKI